MDNDLAVATLSSTIFVVLIVLVWLLMRWMDHREYVRVHKQKTRRKEEPLKSE